MEIILLTSGDPQVYDRASYTDSFNVSELSSLTFRVVLMMLHLMVSCSFGVEESLDVSMFIKVEWSAAVFKCIHDSDWFIND
jgi:hypothetical protein